jgi:hypothetical protein
MELKIRTQPLVPGCRAAWLFSAWDDSGVSGEDTGNLVKPSNSNFSASKS